MTDCVETRPIEVILTVDPGRAKCGVAVVSGPAAERQPDAPAPIRLAVKCLHKDVVETLRLTCEVGDMIRRFPEVGRIVVGSGTGSAPLRRALQSTFTHLPVEVIDEHRSSERARARYLQENIPFGWRKLIPPTMRTPDRPYDDYVALILAEDFFASRNS